MKDFVRFGVILNRMASMTGWVLCLALLRDPRERSAVGFVLLLGWTFLQTIGVLGFAARWLLGRLDESEEKVWGTADKLRAHLGERKAKGVYAALYAAMLAVMLALPVGLNQI